MNGISGILQDKTLKPKGRVEALSGLLLSGELGVKELLVFAEKATAANRATCIEVMEQATRKDPAIATTEFLQFVINCLAEDSPRIKWESARVIGNVAHLFPSMLKGALPSLLANAGHSGTVVRWSSAYALGAILKATKGVGTLLSEVENLAAKEENNGVRKHYETALKKVRQVKR